MRRLAAAPLLLASVAAAGCATLGRMAEQAIERPRVEVVGARLLQADLEGATVAFDLVVENPNGLGLRVARVAWSIDVEGSRVVAGHAPGGVAIPARGRAPVQLDARLPWHAVPRLLENLSTRREVAYRLEASLGVETPLGVIDVAVAHAGELPTPRPPTVRLVGLGARLASLTHAELELRLGVANPNAFPIPGGALEFDLSIGGEGVASSNGARLAGVGPRAEELLTVPVRLSLVGIGGGAAAAIRGGGTEVRVVGRLRLGGLTVPFDLTGRTSGAR